MEIFQSMDLFVDNSVIMMKLMKLMKMLQFSLFFRKMWTFSIKFSDQVFPDASICNLTKLKQMRVCCVLNTN